MVKIKNTCVVGLREAKIRSGFPMIAGEPVSLYDVSTENIVDEMVKKAKDRSIKLGNVPSGSGHDNFLKGITVTFDIQYPLYFSKQMQRYHFMDFISSQSTMHTITARGDIKQFCNKYVNDEIIDIINAYIRKYNLAFNDENRYETFMKIVSNLPSGFQLWAGMTTNYLQLKTIYNQRYNHKLKEDWGVFCKWIEKLPEFKELCLDYNLT